MQDMKKESLDNLSRLIQKKLYSSAKNLADWCCSQWPEAFEPDSRDGCYRIWVRAEAAKNLCDYAFALETVRELMEKNPAYYPDILGGLEKVCREEIEESGKQLLVCENERLKRILERLMYVYDTIDKPVHIYVAQDEEAYNTFYKEAFPGGEIEPFGSFQASCFYGDPEKYWIVFKTEYLADSIDDEEILGLCAHEMGHLDLLSKNIAHRYAHTKYSTPNDLMITERLNDLYVLSKGLAWPLYRSRLRFGAAPAVMSPQEIHEYMLKLRSHH